MSPGSDRQPRVGAVVELGWDPARFVSADADR